MWQTLEIQRWDAKTQYSCPQEARQKSINAITCLKCYTVNQKRSKPGSNVFVLRNEETGSGSGKESRSSNAWTVFCMKTQCSVVFSSIECSIKCLSSRPVMTTFYMFNIGQVTGILCLRFLFYTYLIRLLQKQNVWGWSAWHTIRAMDYYHCFCWW